MALITVTWSVPLPVRVALARQLGRLDMPATSLELEEWIRRTINEAMSHLVEQPAPKPTRRILIKRKGV